MTFKCAHISDIHWRGLKRHEEYRSVFEKLFEKLKEEKPNIIFIGGDIVHSKTQGISPEIIDNLTWWFNSLASIAPTHVILGNHDGLILNKDRQDAISPIISALKNDNIFLYKNSGVYPTGIDGFNWCVFSCFDEENWDKVKPIKGDINIACFHGAVWGSKTDIDWELEGEVNLSFFDGYDFSFLGDIHKLQYLDNEKRVAYPGSTVQQNYGEDIKKGFLLWEIKNSNDYKSKFISVDNPHPFITIDWKGSVEKTLPYIMAVKKGSRFRIRSNSSITQVEIKLLHHYLKEDKLAKEIVYQNTGKNEIDTSSLNTTVNRNFNITNSSKRKDLLNDFFGDIVEEERINEVNNLYSKYLDEVTIEKSDSNSNHWSVHSLKFDNTFSYGKDNFINFDNLEGVVGLFGNNRAGKSSIPGSLMYCLFNSSDRGSLKNQDIVNTRKGSCKAIADISIGQSRYTIERSTTKRTDKKGNISSITNLNLSSLDNFSEENQTEEQRRETEKIIKNLIGTPEDFLYTTFASQGQMNTFIQEKSSARKTVLSKFLKLDLYDSLYKNSREDYIVLKNKQKSLEKKNWDDLVSNQKEKIDDLENLKQKTKDIIFSLREKEIEIKLELNNIEKSNEHPSGYTLDQANKEKNYLKEKLKSFNEELVSLNRKIELDSESLEKIDNFKRNYTIENLKEDKEKLDNLKLKLNNIKRNKIFLDEELKRNKNSLKILEEVPCDENYSSCKFIKDAYSSKDNIETIVSEIKDIENNVLEISSAIKSIEKQDLEEKIKKFNDILNKEYKINIDLERNKEKISINEEKININNEKLKRLEIICSELEDISNNDLIIKEKELKQRLKEISSDIYDKENLVTNLGKDIYSSEVNIESLEKEKIEYYKIIDEWKTFDLFTYSVSKKGIPTMIINNSLPQLNKEINKILSGVSSFNISLEEEGNNLNVYIDYGDSKRVIECASGMEKMITSIAIRVALINLSSLPKSNIFIIDEGFGALDDSNIESCSRLLTSLKKYFKTILIISHVDSIKDIVDKNIEITRKGNDSYVYYS